mmetsp:Transcript_22482/g.27727  ORF Transcript_22482/g.27727 Transcript_22482/m.27727 type:complete len:141 (-) Transcript_22482:1460-1882(-)
MVIQERSLEFRLTEQSSVPIAFLIERKLYMEIIYNLIQNAVKFNKPKGSIIATVSYDKENAKLWTMIEDTGVGISPKIKSNLFIAFRSQTLAMRGQKGQAGIGTGLSNSKCLVNALAGDINIQSKPNKGTIVTFSVDIMV